MDRTCCTPAVLVPVRMSNAERRRLHRQAQARYRSRQRDGLEVLPVVALTTDVALMLQDLGWLPAGDTASRAELATALSKWLYQTVTDHQRQRWPEA